jgi:hypothetical protein
MGRQGMHIEILQKNLLKNVHLEDKMRITLRCTLRRYAERLGSDGTG